MLKSNFLEIMDLYNILDNLTRNYSLDAIEVAGLRIYE